MHVFIGKHMVNNKPMLSVKALYTLKVVFCFILIYTLFYKSHSQVFDEKHATNILLYYFCACIAQRSKVQFKIVNERRINVEAHIRLQGFWKHISRGKKDQVSYFLFINYLSLLECVVVNREASWEAAVNDDCNLIFKIYLSRSCAQ